MSSTSRQAGRIGSPAAGRALESRSAFGRLLRGWRTRRRVSQLDLAVEAGVSSRHVSFIETGRAQPSREMVLMLARVLDVPLRDRNDLLTAAGYAALYQASDLGAPALEQARRALDFMLRQQEPYPAIASQLTMWGRKPREWNMSRIALPFHSLAAEGSAWRWRNGRLGVERCGFAAGCPHIAPTLESLPR